MPTRKNRFPLCARNVSQSKMKTLQTPPKTALDSMMYYRRNLSADPTLAPRARNAVRPCERPPLSSASPAEPIGID
jgi:hypothetical protein